MARDYIIKDSNGKDKVLKDVVNVILTDTNGETVIFSETKESLRMYGDFCVKVIDYNGEIIKKEMLDSGDVFELPEPPTNDRLIFQEWSSPVEIIDNKVTVTNQDIVIGPIYTTKSGLTEIDLEISAKTGFEIVLNDISANGEIDWGDGNKSTTDGGAKYHTYASEGKYTIKADITGFNVPIFGQEEWNPNRSVKRIHFGSSLCSPSNSFPILQFANLQGLEYITFPKGESLMYLAGYTFVNDYKLKCIILPSNFGLSPEDGFSSLRCYSVKNFIIPLGFSARYINIGQMFFELEEFCIPNGLSFSPSVNGVVDYATKLKRITLPSSQQMLASSAFSECVSLNSVTLNEGLTSIDVAAFSRCSGLEKIKFPSTLTSIGFNAFNSAFIKTFDFTSCSQVVSLASYPSDIGIMDRNDVKIFVPDSLYNDWISDSHWSSVTNNIYRASEMED